MKRFYKFMRRTLFVLPILLAACIQIASDATPAPTPTPFATAAPTTPPDAATSTQLPPQPTAVSPVAPAPTLTPSQPSDQPPVPLAQRWIYPTARPPLALDLYSLDGGPLPDLLFGTSDGTVLTVAQNGSEYWRVTQQAAVRALLGANLDGDANGDVVTGNDAGTITVLEGGVTRWTYQQSGPVTALLLFEDGPNPLLLSVASNGQFTGLGRDGVPLWQGKISDASVTAARRADVNGDAAQDAVLASQDGSVVAVTQQGGELWRAQLPGAVRQLATPDLNGDGAAEVVAGTASGQLLALTSTGAPLWQQELDGAIPAVHAADLDGDSVPELLAGSGTGGTLTALDTNGRVLWQQSVAAAGLWSITTADLEGDGRIEIVTGSDDGLVTILDETGHLRAAFPLRSPVYQVTVADVVRGPDSPQPEIVVRTNNALVLLDTEGNGGTATAPPAAPENLLNPPAGLLPEEGVTLVALGDVSLAPPLLDRAYVYGGDYLLDGLRPLLQEADVVAFRPVEPFTAGGVPGAGPFIAAAPPHLSPLLRGTDVAFLAGNHILDWGLSGLNDTVAALQALGIATIGAGATPETAAASHLLEADGLRFAFLSFTDAAVDGDAALAMADVAAITAAVSAAGTTADYVIVALHTTGNGPRVSQPQQVYAHAAVDAGASLVIGYGPEQLQDTELYNGGYIAYALGRFSPPSAGSTALLRATFTADGLQPPELLLTGAADGWQPQLLAAVDGSVARVTDFPPPTAAPTPGDAAGSTLPHYEINVDLNYYGHTAAISQTVRITNDSDAGWAEVVFHAAPAYWGGMFTLDETTVNLDGVAQTAVVNRENTMLRVQMPRLVASGESFTVALRYRLALPRLDPIGWGPEGNAGWDSELVQMGDWYPALVPFADGSWQTWEYWPVGDPVISRVADFDVFIAAAPELLIAAPGFLNVTEDGRRHYRLQGARAFAFLASPNYVSFSGDAGGIPVQVYVTGGNQSLGPVVLNAAAQAVNLFNELYGPYPYPELIIAENGFLTAMEYSAIVSLSGFAFDAYEGTADSLLVSITAHEVAHQWWYGAVGNDQVREGWLDESLAMMSELLFYERYYPSYVDWWWWYRVDRWEPAGPVDMTIYEHTTSEEFVHNMYGQAAYFMADLRATMGDAAFRNLLPAFFAQYQGQFAQGRDFLDLAQEQTSVDLGPLFSLYFRE